MVPSIELSHTIRLLEWLLALQNDDISLIKDCDTQCIEMSNTGGDEELANSVGNAEAAAQVKLVIEASTDTVWIIRT